MLLLLLLILVVEIVLLLHELLLLVQKLVLLLVEGVHVGGVGVRRQHVRHWRRGNGHKRHGRWTV